MEKSCRKCAQKSSPRLLLLLLNNPKSYCMLEIILKIRYFKEDCQKALKKLTLFCLWNPVLFNGQSYQKQNQSLPTL